MKIVTIILSGMIFALGLSISGMTDANKVIAFLNPMGGWDPSLAFVMVGAIGVHLSIRSFIVRRSAPRFADAFEHPPNRPVDSRLIAGAGLFGMGWGLGGFCPGPGLVSATGLGQDALWFTGSMIAGMMLFNAWNAAFPPQVIGDSR